MHYNLIEHKNQTLCKIVSILNCDTQDYIAQQHSNFRIISSWKPSQGDHMPTFVGLYYALFAIIKQFSWI